MRKAGRGGRLIPIHSSRVVEMRGALIGRVVGGIAGDFSVDFRGTPHGPTLARSAVPLRELALACAGGAHPEVLLLFETERSDRPLIVGTTNYQLATGSWGDVGAASGALGCVLAVQSWRREYVEGPREGSERKDERWGK